MEALKLPHVDYVEEDAYVFAQSIPWNLGRIVPPQPSSGAYSPPNKGDLVEIYLLDTSVQSTHREIEGRVFVTDFESVPEEDGTRFHRQASKGDSHGTHMAGVLSGRDAGVATGANVRSLRVLNCQGKGTVSGTLIGLEFIKATLEAHPYAPLVALLAFAGGSAAGNYKDDACLYSPASEPEVITVGATNSEDQPVQGIRAACTGDIFACHGATVLACITAMLLSAEPQLSLAELRQRLLHFATKNVMDTAWFPEEQRLQTPNSVAGLPTQLGEGHRLEFIKATLEAQPYAPLVVLLPFAGAYSREMLSCSSFSHSGRRLGEHMEDKDGQKQCVAHNAFRGRGVYAIARCCMWPRAKCWINVSSPVAEGAGCSLQDHVLTGCSFHSPAVALGDGGRPVAGPGSGPSHCASRMEVMARALCCPATDLECRVKEHTSLGSAGKVMVSCDDGWTLTGCNAHSQSPGTMGAYAVDDTCVAASIPGSSTAVVIAICCRSRQ
ncbi:PREDICTED: proprotein convertase subtilisin/kexin type 9 [Pygoscelis adeliae]|uniref:proprotein convertase subtilisin/kexin type 9 n=1 Tax=Pygoscelis adeliae TaxID=9238 RepID=UPI0004F4E0D8|nr:PREDICTED: proprotein convertase subtilisin/kexin type 9 [Pygoscelis adeliae]